MPQLHENSLAAFRSLDRQTRRRRILAIFAKRRIPLSDREVMAELGFDDPNTARPRLTELVHDGSLIEVGKIKDAETGRSVRICALGSPFQATIGDIL